MKKYQKNELAMRLQNISQMSSWLVSKLLKRGDETTTPLASRLDDLIKDLEQVVERGDSQ